MLYSQKRNYVKLWCIILAMIRYFFVLMKFRWSPKDVESLAFPKSNGANACADGLSESRSGIHGSVFVVPTSMRPQYTIHSYALLNETPIWSQLLLKHHMLDQSHANVRLPAPDSPEQEEKWANPQLCKQASGSASIQRLPKLSKTMENFKPDWEQRW